MKWIYLEKRVVISMNMAINGRIKSFIDKNR